MIVRLTQAKHSSAPDSYRGFVTESPTDLELGAEGDAELSLADAVDAQERARQCDSYFSRLRFQKNGEVWVSWWQPETASGYDRYQLVTENGVRLGGCWSHDAGECWSLDDPFPPPHEDARNHVVVGPLGRVFAHRDCEWATTGVPEVLTYESAGLDRCCARPWALAASEQALMSAVSTHIGSYLTSPSALPVFDRLLGWRVFGVYDGHTQWPGYDPQRGLDPETRDRLCVQVALQELG
ncbi:MAG: hypothetical protein F2667_06105 [Actinobacteria bacterium]|uniref:Unannotated protein n=1 Tax=freshwater metagenome TaxID=449393 RepID=A0A6J6Q840_9ZZZZ|nr:hypothetical protein [Actinomycetota bacterium]